MSANVVFPFDVWESIAAHMSVRSVLNLRCTCRNLYDMMGESRGIWHQILEDIIGINPAPDTSRRIATMSAAELRSRAIVALRMHNLWSSSSTEIVPKRTVCLPCPMDIARAEIGSGGRWILTQHFDNSLKLWNSSMTEPPLAVIVPPSLKGAPIREPIPSYMGLLLTASDEGQLALTVDRHTHPEAKLFPVYRVYHIDDLNNSIRLLTTFWRPDRYCRYAIDRDLVVTAWTSDDVFFVSIRKIFTKAPYFEEHTLRFGPEVLIEYVPIVSLLCPHVLTLLTPSKLTHYNIPKFGHGTAVRPSESVPSALAVYDVDVSDTTSFRWRSPSCQHCHDGRSNVITYSDRPVCTVLPPPQDEDASVIRFDMGTRLARGLLRMLWHEPGGDLLHFHSFIHSTRAPDHPGYMRLSTSEAANIGRTTTIVADVSQTQSTLLVRDLSWDECTGKICALMSTYTTWDRADFDSIVLIDLLD